jgi:hypothetical protein
MSGAVTFRTDCRTYFLDFANGESSTEPGFANGESALGDFAKGDSWAGSLANGDSLAGSFASGDACPGSAFASGEFCGLVGEVWAREGEARPTLIASVATVRIDLMVFVLFVVRGISRTSGLGCGSLPLWANSG